MNLLYVSRNEDSQKALLQRMHGMKHVTITLACSAAEVKALLKTSSFDLVVIEHLPPLLDARQLWKSVLQHAVDFPCVVLTAERDQLSFSDVDENIMVYHLASRASDEACLDLLLLLEYVWRCFVYRVNTKPLQVLEKVFDATCEAIMIMDSQCCIETVNPAFSVITGYRNDELIGVHVDQLCYPHDNDGGFARVCDMCRGDGCWEGEFLVAHKSQKRVPVWLSLTLLHDEGGRFVAMFTDMSKRKAKENEIWHQANFDPLTDLPNRILLIDRAEEALRRARREETSLAIIFVDLDHFKFINDHFGHALGDDVLIEVANRISSVLRDSDTVVRLAGDEFIVLMPFIHKTKDAAKVAEKIVLALAKPYSLGEKCVYLSASAGIAVFPGDGDSVDTLLSHADMAMYQAKDCGRNQFVFFDGDMNRRLESRKKMEHALQLAIEKNQLQLFYQPIFHVKSGSMIAAEVFIRWPHPELGMLLPADFVPLAEDSGQIVALGEWVVKTVCSQIQGFPEGFKVYVNVSPVQMLHGDLQHLLKASLMRYQLPEQALGLEITEQVMGESPQVVIQKMHKMKAMGLSFWIDDFGTGFSSMRYLKDMPVDGLKLDREFIADIDADENKTVLVKAMVEMAHHLNLGVVAEGVETEAELAVLKHCGCDYVQGFLLGRPMPLVNFLASAADEGVDFQ